MLSLLLGEEGEAAVDGRGVTGLLERGSVELGDDVGVEATLEELEGEGFVCVVIARPAARREGCRGGERERGWGRSAGKRGMLRNASWRREGRRDAYRS